MTFDFVFLISKLLKEHDHFSNFIILSERIYWAKCLVAGFYFGNPSGYNISDYKFLPQCRHSVCVLFTSCHFLFPPKLYMPENETALVLCNDISHLQHTH